MKVATRTEAVADPAMALGLDLETWRAREGLTYDQLGEVMGLGSHAAAQARRYALGERWPGPEILDVILGASEGAVTLFAMHQRRARFVRAHGKPRRFSPI